MELLLHCVWRNSFLWEVTAGVSGYVGAEVRCIWKKQEEFDRFFFFLV